jgi:hypothetical protein
MKPRPMTQEEREQIEREIAYDPSTGAFFNRIDRGRGGRLKAGSQIKTTPNKTHGYLIIHVGGRGHLAHRVAWLLAHGEWPKNQIDHIDHDITNNRLSNLRVVTHEGNMRNLSLYRTNTSGHTGVYNDHGRWVAYYYRNGTRREIGRYGSKDEAVAARQAANRDYCFHENHGTRRAEVA